MTTVATDPRPDQILQALTDAGEAGLARPSLDDLPGTPAHTTKRLLAGLADTGQVRHDTTTNGAQMATRDPLNGATYDDVIREALAEARSAANSREAAVATAWATIARVAVLAKEAERTR